MTTFDPTDPAAEIKYLKAMERAKWPDMPPDDAALKKKPTEWPDGKKKKTPRHVARAMVDPTAPGYRPMVYKGISLAEVIRAVVLFLAAVGAALLID